MNLSIDAITGYFSSLDTLSMVAWGAIVLGIILVALGFLL